MVGQPPTTRLNLTKDRLSVPWEHMGRLHPRTMISPAFSGPYAGLAWATSWSAAACPGPCLVSRGQSPGTSMPSSHILPLGTFVDQWVLARHPSNEPTLTARLSQQPRLKTTGLPKRPQVGTRAGPLALSGQQTHAGLVVKRPGLVPDLGGTGQRPFGCLASPSTAPFRSPCRQCGPVLPRHRKPQTRVIDAWRPIFVVMRIDTEAPSRFLGSCLGLFMALTYGLRRATCRHNPSREFAVTEAIPWCRADAVSSAEDMMQFQHESSGLCHSHGL
ncbi:predicted protein [Verticillium alfalfae VaMs.102]|uniref:Predicted protein n=1 Tax=Verticillium alfalfae (strain VaMs.102 / ATCC MYA-4576 / FGSC 10136) TaxID=526221 RepID=C9SCD2_VERA1|nr:predicted protein [Verticillium alfalfae VaMs.102]EEY16747.1 predicted protein [Verticillium alfalfae VaMs.102]